MKETDICSSDWFNIKEVENDIFIIEEPGYVQSFLINGTSRSALLDTGSGIQNIFSAIKALVKDRVSVFNTHWHLDHVGGNARFSEIGISPLESHLIQRDISSAELLETFDRIYPAHCEYPFPKEFFNTVMDAFKRIVRGAPPDEIDTTWHQEVHRYHFNGFDILIKPPGTKGVQIFNVLSTSSGE